MHATHQLGLICVNILKSQREKQQTKEPEQVLNQDMNGFDLLPGLMTRWAAGEMTVWIETALTERGMQETAAITVQCGGHFVVRHISKDLVHRKECADNLHYMGKIQHHALHSEDRSS